MSLNSFQRCCPTFIFDIIRSLWQSINKILAKKYKNQSNGLQQLQEQQFQFSTGSKLSPEQKISKHQKDQPHLIQIQANENLSIRLNLNNEPTEQEQMKLNQKEEQEEVQISLKLSKFNFNLNLEPYHQYYNTIEGKTKNIKDLFSLPTKNILKKSNKSEINVQEIQTMTGYRMIISYKLPCSYSFFKKINQDQQITSHLNAVIKQQKTLEAIQSNLTINHLSFKKFMLLEPRYFHYLKYENSTQNCHWQICTSIKGRAEVEQRQKECQLTSISCFEQRDSWLIANSYLQVDLKSNIKANKVVLRVYQQLSSYIDGLYTYVKQNYHEQQI